MSEAAAAKRDRSPAFPVIPLDDALQRLEQFENHFKRSPARPEKVGDAWAVKAKGYADRIVAALRYFGFLDYQGQASGRSVTLSDEGRKYLRAQQDSIKREVIAAAALRPKQLAKFWGEWGKDRPADAVCLDDLVLKHGFSDRGARDFLRVYDATIDFAKLAESATIAPVNDGDVKADPVKPEIEVGDLIQVEIDGALALAHPDRVRAVQQHEGRRWVFIETSEAGIPMEQAVLAEKGTLDSKPQPIVAPKLPLPEGADRPPPTGARRLVFALTEGDVVLTVPDELSAESVEDLDAYLEVFMRKARRGAGLSGEKST